MQLPIVFTGLNFSKPPESPGTTTTKETSSDYVGRSQTTEHKAEPSNVSDLNRKPFKTTTPVPANITRVKSESPESTKPAISCCGNHYMPESKPEPRETFTGTRNQ
ncbi:hypothetical protein F2Q68_00006473 [Brassica cretica]|nr:hypothetical protein F2Q68_00006473 [Brassica cretica]